jgi:beta-glucosidase
VTTPPTWPSLTGAGASFLWAVGIEDTAIGTAIRDGGRTLDEYELTEHYDRWRTDLDLVAELGCAGIRYGFPWYRLNPDRGVWDWKWLDNALEYAVAECGLTVIADLVHYGTPAWLVGGFTDPGYPDAVAEYAAAVAARYGGLIRHYTPLNEPLVTASFCGERAVWPPYDTGEAGWARVVTSVSEGIQATIAAIRGVQSDASIVHVDAALVWSSADRTLSLELQRNIQRSFLPTDLVTGQVDERHPLYTWLIGLGISANRLAAIRSSAQQPDAIGVNYYPELSCRELVRHRGELVSVAVDGGTKGLSESLRSYHARYGAPVLVSETAVDGATEKHQTWLDQSTAAVSRLREEGVPVVGYTWWPLFDFVDWSWASAGRVVEEFYFRDAAGEVGPVHPPIEHDDGVVAYLRRMGLYRLEREASGLTRVDTAAARHFGRLTQDQGSLLNNIASDPVP